MSKVIRKKRRLSFPLSLFLSFYLLIWPRYSISTYQHVDIVSRLRPSNFLSCHFFLRSVARLNHILKTKFQFPNQKSIRSRVIDNFKASEIDNVAIEIAICFKLKLKTRYTYKRIPNYFKLNNAKPLRERENKFVYRKRMENGKVKNIKQWYMYWFTTRTWLLHRFWYY